MGESLINLVKTKFQAVNQFNKREEVRKNIALYTLLILMLMFVFEEVSALMTPNVVIIEQAHASLVEIPEEEVARDSVSKTGESSLREERGEEKRNLSIPQAGDIEQMILAEFGEDGRLMVAIAKAESGQDLNPKAYNENRNGTWDVGVFQINQIHGYDKKWLEDPVNNIAAAKKIKNTQGLKAWVSFSNGNYLYNM